MILPTQMAIAPTTEACVQGMMRKWLRHTIISLPALSLCTSCIFDSPTICYSERDLLEFRLTYDGKNYLDEKISHIDVYLFDAHGQLYAHRQLSAQDHGKIRLDLFPYGTYKVLAIGNMEGYGQVNGLDGAPDSSLTYEATNFLQDGKVLNNGDPIYWGEQTFERKKGADNAFTVEMANVHAMIRVRVEWENVPPSASDCYICLTDIHRGYNLDPTQSTAIGQQIFPAFTSERCSMAVRAPLRQMALDATLFSLRFRDSELPALSIYQDGQNIVRPLALSDIFRQWGWFADRTQVQEYGISLLIKTNGGIEVKPYTGLGAGDWEDGGQFG